METGSGTRSPRWVTSLPARISALVRAIDAGDEATVQEAVLRLSQSRRWLAPLGLVVGAFVMLYQGLRLVFSNWRLTLIQIVPAMWIWVAMLDLRMHVLHGRTHPAIRGTGLILPAIGIIVLTAGSFYLNAVFAFAIAKPGPPNIRRGFETARSNAAVVLAWGGGVGLLLGFAVLISPRWHKPWFTVTLGLALAVMMICYISVPARLLGVKQTSSRVDKLAASALSGALGAVVSTPPYLLGRLGILMLGSKALFVPGVFIVALGFTLQAGTTGAVRAILLSARLVAGRELVPDAEPTPDSVTEA